MPEAESNPSSDVMEMKPKLYITVLTNPPLTMKSELIYIAFVIIVTTGGTSLTTLLMERVPKTIPLTYPCRISYSIIDSIKLNVQIS